MMYSVDPVNLIVERRKTDQKINCKNGFPGGTVPSGFFVIKNCFRISPNKIGLVTTITTNAFVKIQDKTTLVRKVL